MSWRSVVLILWVMQMALSSEDLNEFWLLLNEINRLAQQDLVALWRLLDSLPRGEAWDLLRSGVPEIVQLYRGMSVETAMLFYEETQGLAATSTGVASASRVPPGQLESSLRWAFFAPQNVEVLGLIGGIVQKNVTDGARQYALESFDNARSGWYRAARPGACNFCRMLATRSATGSPSYGTAEAAGLTGQFHPNCMCVPVLESEYSPPDYVKDWADVYFEASKNAGSSDHRVILSEMRKISGHSH